MATFRKILVPILLSLSACGASRPVARPAPAPGVEPTPRAAPYQACRLRRIGAARLIVEGWAARHVHDGCATLACDGEPAFHACAGGEVDAIAAR